MLVGFLHLLVPAAEGESNPQFLQHESLQELGFTENFDSQDGSIISLKGILLIFPFDGCLQLFIHLCKQLATLILSLCVSFAYIQTTDPMINHRLSSPKRSWTKWLSIWKLTKVCIQRERDCSSFYFPPLNPILSINVLCCSPIIELLAFRLCREYRNWWRWQGNCPCKLQ